MNSALVSSMFMWLAVRLSSLEAVTFPSRDQFRLVAQELEVRNFLFLHFVDLTSCFSTAGARDENLLVIDRLGFP